MNWSKEWNKDLIDTSGKSDIITGIDAIDNGPYSTTLRFQDGHKRRTIDVIIVGDLALDYDDDGWDVYHIPTLSKFTKAVPPSNIHPGLEYVYDRDALLNWMKKVQEQYPTSWQMLRLLTPENYADKGETAKRIIQEWCLSVKVE